MARFARTPFVSILNAGTAQVARRQRSNKSSLKIRLTRERPRLTPRASALAGAHRHISGRPRGFRPFVHLLTARVAEGRVLLAVQQRSGYIDVAHHIEPT